MAFTPKAKFVSGTPFMVDYTPSGAVNAGDILVINGRLAITHLDIAAGKLGAGSLGRGVYDVANDTTQAYSARTIVYFGTTSSLATASTSGTFKLGVAWADQASGATATTIRVIVSALANEAA